MLKNYLVLTVAFIFLFLSQVNGQTGIIKGRITNKLTNEAIGFAGRKEGVAALCACMIKEGDRS